MKLYFRELGKGKPMIILHGLFGFSDNWQTLATKFSEFFRVILIDFRNHGHSPWSDDFSYNLMVDDLKELIDDLNLENLILVGHSMGGKVAMHFAQKFPEKIEKLVVVDIGVKQYARHHQEVLEAFNKVDLNGITARSQVELILSDFIESKGVRQFLLKNLYWKEKGELAWRVNFAVLEKSMPEILAALPYKEVLIPSLFIRGELSNYIEDNDVQELESFFSDLSLKTIKNAGHWVHADAPEEFTNTVLEFCLR
ncbi:MAG: alpha/beta fold hydrolase [Flavobacteriia bacterium]|nr:alpha/beta fold hydrolase [Flavobacteriia bacterium]